MGALDDKFWLEAGDFAKRIQTPDESVIGPMGFDELVPGAIPYGRRQNYPHPGVVVLHKGHINSIGSDAITDMIGGLTPAFANEVFVVFARFPSEPVSLESDHYKTYRIALSAAPRHPGGATADARPRPIAYLGNNSSITTTIYGHKIYVDTRDQSLTPHILIDGAWERWITKAFRALVRPGMTVIDIGANIGWYSILGAAAVGPEGTVMSFEANPALAELVFRSLMVNGFVKRTTVVPKAVYETSKRLTLNVFANCMANNSLFDATELAELCRDEIRTLEVDCVSLDDYLPAGTHVDFVKMDAEGAEPFILRGARRVIAENPHLQIMMEVTPKILAKSVDDVGAFFGEIRDLGLSMWRVDLDSTLIPTDAEELSRLAHCDVVLRRA